MPQIPPVLPFAVLSCIALAAAVWSGLMLFLGRIEEKTARERSAAAWARQEATWRAEMENILQRIESFAAELRHYEEQAPHSRESALGIQSKPSLNLTKRAQALRMHRRGDPPEQIAALLKLPVQEVTLLLKVQQIVFSNIEKRIAG